jgi:hypothetical protein
MFDDSLRLQDNPQLLALLTHYAKMGAEDRATWRHRLMEMEGVEPKQLSVLHGELIAFEWIEQNTGQPLSACYRITLSGLREYQRIHGGEIAVECLETPEKSQPRYPRKKRQKTESPEATVVGVPEESLVPAS